MGAGDDAVGHAAPATDALLVGSALTDRVPDHLDRARAGLADRVVAGASPADRARAARPSPGRTRPLITSLPRPARLGRLIGDALDEDGDGRARGDLGRGHSGLRAAMEATNPRRWTRLLSRPRPGSSRPVPSRPDRLPVSLARPRGANR